MNFNHLQPNIKKNNIRRLNDVYVKLGFTKTDISRWKNNPFSTHASTKLHKIKVVLKAMEILNLSPNQAENLANKAGLSLFSHIAPQTKPLNELKILLKNCGSKQRRQLYHLAVSERMVQYYLTGKAPTKQALLAITIILGLSITETEHMLRNFGYCLSSSLVNDAVVRWFMENDNGTARAELLYSINETLDILDLPLLLTKQINR